MTPRGIRNKNPLNIIHEENELWRGENLIPDGVYCRFSTVVYGLRAGFVLLDSYAKYHDIGDVSGIIARFAPPPVNDTGAYIADVCERTGFEPNYLIKTKSDKIALLKAMVHHENGCDLDNDGVYTAAYNLSKRR